ncbi:hypothetical protein [Corynebacterium sp. Marseille-P3884]|uniref:hypothetical protein n=1 Tax=Corynebacterium sp. Marseille-P3884 TaxID=2495409 RepID=UPI001FF08D55|nr:hypothetical protein [Corynebacterium sp. Marseille-P3884]
MTTSISRGHDSANTPQPDQPEANSATDAFDIRNVIGALLGFYGIVLIICSFFLDPGVNADTGAAKNASDNLWVGIALAVSAAIFFVWARLRPISFDPETLEATD